MQDQSDTMNRTAAHGAFLRAADAGALEREFRRPAMLAMLVFYTCIILLFVWMANSEKENSIEKEGRLARAAIVEAQSRLAETAEMRLKSAADPLPVLKALRAEGTAAEVMLLHPSGEIAVHEGPLDERKLHRLSRDILPLVDRAASSGRSVDAILSIDGKPWLMVITRAPGASADSDLALLARPLDKAFLNDLGRRFDLDALEWSADAEGAGGRSRLLAHDGRPIGWLGWQPDLPAHKRIRNLLPWIAIGMLAILVLAARILNTWGDMLARLRLRDEQLQAVLRHAADGIVITTAEGRIEAVNMAASQLFARRAETLVGLPLRSLLRNPADPNGPLPTMALQPLSHGPAVPIELETMPDGGESRTVEVAVGRIESGDEMLHAVSLRDITEQKAFAGRLAHARDAAEAASRAKSEFLASMSHELRTPLNAIIGFSELMAEEVEASHPLSRHVEYLNDISHSGRHLLGLIEDVLEYAKYETGRMALSEAPCNLGTMINDCMDAIRPQAAPRNIALTQLGIVPGMVLCDGRKLKAAIGNILANAVKFTPSGRIALSIEDRADAGIAIIVADTGIGIDDEQQSRVLDPFYQSDMRLSRRYEGIGLGLPLAKAVMELHGGRLELDSKPGEGTTVTLVIPSARLMSLTAPQRHIG